MEEVQVLTANYPVEYGRSSGGQIRIVTKSGSSKFHGSTYEYLRNSILDANCWSRNLNPQTNFVAPFRCSVSTSSDTTSADRLLSQRFSDGTVRSSESH